MAQSRIVACPRCGAKTPFSPRNPWRPFCSERCKLIDLGRWANETYRVAGNTKPPEKSETDPR